MANEVQPEAVPDRLRGRTSMYRMINDIGHVHSRTISGISLAEPDIRLVLETRADPWYNTFE